MTFAEALLRVPSFGPVVGLNLCNVRDGVRRLLDDTSLDIDLDDARRLRAYANALDLVCHVGAQHQSLIIRRLSALAGEVRR